MSLSVWNLKKGEWKTAAWLLGLLVLGLLLLLVRPGAASGGGASPPVTSGGGSSRAPISGDPLVAEEEAMDSSLATALGRITGAGTVTVRVHLASGPKTDYAENVQSSITGSGSQAASSTNQQLASGSSGGPVVQGTLGADVAGVLVVASGASDPAVALELSQAVQAATGAPAYAIVVLSAEGGKGQ